MNILLSLTFLTLSIIGSKYSLLLQSSLLLLGISLLFLKFDNRNEKR